MRTWIRWEREREWAPTCERGSGSYMSACVCTRMCVCMVKIAPVKWKYIAERWGGKATVSIWEIYYIFRYSRPSHMHRVRWNCSLVTFCASSFLFILLSTEITQCKDELFLWSHCDNKCVIWLCACACDATVPCISLCSTVHLYSFNSFLFIIFLSSSPSSSVTAVVVMLPPSILLNDFSTFHTQTHTHAHSNVCARSNVTESKYTTTANTAKRFYDCFIFDWFRACVYSSICSLNSSRCQLCTERERADELHANLNGIANVIESHGENKCRRIEKKVWNKWRTNE